jgi:hypothetical protein
MNPNQYLWVKAARFPPAMSATDQDHSTGSPAHRVRPSSTRSNQRRERSRRGKIRRGRCPRAREWRTPVRGRPFEADAVAECRRRPSDIPECNENPAHRQGIKLVVVQMDMGAAHHAGPRTAGVPLHGLESPGPLFPENLEQAAAVVGIGFHRDGRAALYRNRRRVFIVAVGTRERPTGMPREYTLCPHEANMRPMRAPQAIGGPIWRGVLQPFSRPS